jgi:hypothetical protein
VREADLTKHDGVILVWLELGSMKSIRTGEQTEPCNKWERTCEGLCEATDVPAWGGARGLIES